MSDEPIQLSVYDKVAVLTLNRPDRLNAISRKLAMQATAQLAEIAGDSSIGAIIVTGAGRAFCAGGDVSEMAELSDTPLGLEENVDGLRRAQELCWMLYSMPKVTLAAVNGYAMGAGLGIALSCDLRIVSNQSKFGTAYAGVGLGGDYGTTWQLTRLVGPAKAKEMFILGDVIDAPEAHRIGLVNRVVPHESLLEEVQTLAKRIAHGPSVSYRYMKENVNLAMQSDFRSILDREAFTHIRCMQTDDHQEGARAFVEKRPPTFQGR